MVVSIDELFCEEAVLVYPSGTPSDKLKHSYSELRRNSEGKLIDFEAVREMLATLRTDVGDWYLQTTGRPMNTYNLGDKLNDVRERFLSDPRLKSAFEILELPYEEREKIRIPWWNEIAGGEVEHKIQKEEIHIRLGPRHSYETQMIRSGHLLPIKSVSVGGLILTQDDCLAVGLRGGKSYPNLYHINAGSLTLTANLKKGESSVYDVFMSEELEPEFGISNGDVRRATIHSRIVDYSIDRGPCYNFLVEIALTSNELKRRWDDHQNEDKQEHKDIVFVPVSKDGVNKFIRENYKGVCGNRVDRPDSERYILHPGALSLIAFSGMSLRELRQLYTDGTH